jgi:hypothetical protein
VEVTSTSSATARLERAQIEAVVLRAVPCDKHKDYTLGCPDCLTGEQAAALGVPQRREDLGVIASWKAQHRRKRWLTIAQLFWRS